MSGGYIQKPGDFKFFSHLLEFFMQKWMHVRSETKANSLTHGKRLPAIGTGSLCEGAIHNDGDLRAQLKRRTIPAEVRDFLLNRCSGPYIPEMCLVLQFLQANRQRSDGGAIIE